MPAALPLLLAIAVWLPAGRARADSFARALSAFRRGDYASAARALPKLGGALPKNRDYYLHFLGESRFYASLTVNAKYLKPGV